MTENPENAERNARTRILGTIVNNALYEVHAAVGFNDGSLKDIINNDQTGDLKDIVLPWPNSHESQIIPGWFLKRMLHSGFDATLMNLHVPPPTKLGNEDDIGEAEGKKTKKDVETAPKKTTEGAATKKQKQAEANAVHNALKAELKDRGLSVRGKTPVLQERLNDAIAREETEAADLAAKEAAEVAEAEAEQAEQAESPDLQYLATDIKAREELAYDTQQPFDDEETGEEPPNVEGSDPA
ncbi:MAG: hypothetical protein FVQ79_02240 [Planctomycetes bacterium]|nr:hypothetical protein [Planctomycetota bacterium]